MSHWNRRPVLVTGGAGFIGHRLVSRLVGLGADVTVVDDLSRGSRRNISGYLDRIKLIEGGLLDKGLAKKALSGQEVCFHLAARIGGIGYFHRSPAMILRDNSVMSFNLWDAAVQHNTKMICLSSSMVFESATVFPTPESALRSSPPPRTGYGFSKLISEYIATTYNEEFGTEYLIVRPFNAYGPGEVPGDYVGYSHVIPDLVKKALFGPCPLEVLGSGRQTRSFTYVDDVVAAILFLAETCKNDDFNVGNPEESSIIDLARKIWSLCERREKFKVRSVTGFADDVPRRVPDVSKILAAGWEPKVQLDEGLAKTVSWLKHRIPGEGQASRQGG